jgi:hypothetical protein
MDTQKNTDKDPFRSLIGSNGLLEDVPPGFTDKVLERIGIQASPLFKYRPVISIRAWLGIGISMLFLFIFGATTDSDTTGSSATGSVMNMLKDIQSSNSIEYSDEYLMLIALVLVSIFVLMTAERLLVKRI